MSSDEPKFSITHSPKSQCKVCKEEEEEASIDTDRMIKPIDAVETAKDQELLHQHVIGEKFEALKVSLEKGAEVDSRDVKGRTALHLASERADLASANILLERGADPNARDHNGRTVLQYAMRTGCVHIVEKILGYGANINEEIKCPLGIVGTYIHAAVFKTPEILKALLEHGADATAYNSENYMALHLACREGKLEMVRMLVERGCNINATVRSSRHTALSLVIQNPARRTELLTYLLRNDAEVNHRLDSGITLLHYAIRYCGDEVVCRLIRLGADVNARTDHDACIPLHYYYEMSDMSYHVLLYLLSFGSDVNARDHTEQTPLHYAAKVDRDIDDLLDYGAIIDAEDNIKWTPLKYAVKFRQAKNVQLLLDHNADLRKIDYEAETDPAMVNLFAGHLAAKVALKSEAEQQRLKKEGKLDWMMQHWEQCREEVQLMKKEVTCGNLRLIDIIHASKRRVCLLKDQFSTDEILPANLLKLLPHYKFRLERTLVRPLDSKKIIDDVLNTLDHMCPKVIPPEIWDHVIDHLSYGDMLNFMKACPRPNFDAEFIRDNIFM